MLFGYVVDITKEDIYTELGYTKAPDVNYKRVRLNESVKINNKTENYVISLIPLYVPSLQKHILALEVHDSAQLNKVPFNQLYCVLEGDIPNAYNQYSFIAFRMQDIKWDGYK